MTGRPPSSFDAAVAALPGGRAILESRGRAGRLIRGLSRPPDAGAGAMDGYDDVRPQGRLESLLPSEHVQDTEEFLRRHACGEQLYLSRQRSSEPRPDETIGWELTPASLGVTRRIALGLALALRDERAATGQGCLLVLGGHRALRLDTVDEVREALRRPPRCRLDRAPGVDEGARYRIVCADRLPDAMERSASSTAEVTVGPAGGLFVVRPTSMELWRKARRRRGEWRRVASVTWPEGWWRRCAR